MPIIQTPKPSFKEFKETALIHKFSPRGFVLLYEKGKYGWKYRILMDGKNTTKALRYAYISLFGTIETDEVSEVQVDLEGEKGLKMPLQINISFCPDVDDWNTDLKTMTRKHNWEI